jgi:hypothetical protein
MKAKVLFYGLLAMIFAGSVSLTEMESTTLADVTTVASSVNSDEFKRSPAEKREEGYEATEAQAEFDLP